MEKHMHLKAGIDPDGTPHSKFVNDMMMKILMECPNPEDLPDPDDHQRGNIILGTLGAINAGVVANLLQEPEDVMTSMGVIARIANESFQQIAALREQMIAGRHKH